MPRIGDVTPRFDAPAIGLDGVGVWRQGNHLLTGVDWQVGYGQQWVVFGRNGAGKTTLIRVASGAMFPSSGVATVLGHRMGSVDLRSLRKHVGLVTAGHRLPDEESYTVETVALTGHTGTVLPLWDYYDDEVRERALFWLDVMGCAHLADRSIRVCSQGERARVRLARALVAEPTLLVLDEPFAGLDMPGREDLVTAVAALPVARPTLTTVLVTHHVEEVPPSTTHALMLRDGRSTTSGPLGEAFTSDTLSRCLDRPVRLTAVDDGRWVAHLARGRALASGTPTW